MSSLSFLFATRHHQAPGFEPILKIIVKAYGITAYSLGAKSIDSLPQSQSNPEQSVKGLAPRIPQDGRFPFQVTIGEKDLLEAESGSWRRTARINSLAGAQSIRNRTWSPPALPDLQQGTGKYPHHIVEKGVPDHIDTNQRIAGNPHPDKMQIPDGAHRSLRGAVLKTGEIMLPLKRNSRRPHRIDVHRTPNP